MAEETENEGQLRSQMWKHEAMVEWINERDGVDLNQLSAPEIIAYAFARRVEWRQSDVYANLVEEHKAYAAEAAEARKAEAQARKEAAAAEKAAKADKATTKATKATKTTKATKAAKATKAPAAKRASRKASAGTEDPFS